jgi:hypothetical protein
LCEHAHNGQSANTSQQGALSDAESDVTGFEMTESLVSQQIDENQSHLGGVKTAFPSVFHWSDDWDVITDSVRIHRRKETG